MSLRLQSQEMLGLAQRLGPGLLQELDKQLEQGAVSAMRE